MVPDNKNKKPLIHYFLVAQTSQRLFDGITKALVLVNSFFIITSITVFAYGLYQLVLSFVSIARGFGSKFFDGLVTIDMRRYMNTNKPEYAKKLFFENGFIKLALTLAIMAVTFFGANIISNFYGEDVALLLKWSSLLFLVYAFQSMAIIFLQSIVSFAHLSLSAIKELVKLLLIIGFLMFYQFSILEVVIIHVLSEAFATVLMYIFIFAKKYCSIFAPIKSYGKSLFKDIVKEHGLRVLAINSLKEVLRDGPPWIIKIIINTEAVALYSLALNLTSLLSGFLPLAGLKPIMALKADKEKEIQNLFKGGVKYVFWLGTAFLILGGLAVPLAVRLVVPDYIPAIPTFLFMALALPIFGVVKILQSTLAVLREYGILAMRLVNEVLILVLGSVLLLPTIGIVGIGIIYVARHIERVWFLYGRLSKKYPGFKVNLKEFFRLSSADKQIFKELISYSINYFKSVMVPQKKNGR